MPALWNRRWIVATRVVEEASKLARELHRERPELEAEIQEEFALFLDEIYDGGSHEHELELFKEQLEELRNRKI